MTANAQKLALYQYHHSVGPADAVTRHMFLIHSLLSTSGIESRLFASEVHPSLASLVTTFPDASVWNADLLLIHHSMGNPALRKLLSVEIPKAMVFHNVTPPQFFNHDPYLRSLSTLGLSQLEAFRQKVIACFGVSEFNVSLLKSRGLAAQQLPLLDLQQSLTTGSASDITRNRPRLLFVGKLCPHKNQALLIRALHEIRKQSETAEAELVLVGREDPLYARYLRTLTRVLGLEKAVHFTGRVNDTSLAAQYLTADVFVSSSLHEGFCIPLVEAMRFGVPVVALKRGAVSETLGSSGLLVNTENPNAIADAVRLLFLKEEFREAFILRQNERLGELKQFQNRSVLNERLLSVLEKTRSPLLNRKALSHGIEPAQPPHPGS